jgi:hypothetical protein
LNIPGLPSARAVSTRTLKSVWKKLSDKPLPEAYAFTLNSRDFLFILEQIQKTPGVKDTRIKEYGVDFDNSFIEACSFEFEDHWLILVKQSASLRDSLEHELKHILTQTEHSNK